MDFGDILDEWDRMKDRGAPRPEASRKTGCRAALESWLEEKGVEDKDSSQEEFRDRSRDARRFAALKPQAVLDLHGMTAEEAEAAITVFIDSSAREGLEKVLIIHGKGIHSEGGIPVLKKTARRSLEAHPLAGKIGEAARDEGGSGALWVAIRKKAD